MIYDFANSIIDSVREDTITILFMDINVPFGAITNKFMEVSEFKSEVDDYINNHTKEEISGSVQFIVLPKMRRIFACAYVKDVVNIKDETLGYDMDKLELCLLGIARRSRCPLAVLAPEADTPSILSTVSYKILDKVDEIFKDKNVMVYFQ